jgi:hypothetical protein
MHRTLFYDRLPPKKFCREDRIFGKVMQELFSHFKGLVYVTATIPTFVFGKVSTYTSEEEATRSIRARVSAP